HQVVGAARLGQLTHQRAEMAARGALREIGAQDALGAARGHGGQAGVHAVQAQFVGLLGTGLEAVFHQHRAFLALRARRTRLARREVVTPGAAGTRRKAFALVTAGARRTAVVVTARATVIVETRL